MTSVSPPIASMVASGFVPIFNHGNPLTAVAVADALVAGGATAIEFTNRSERAVDVFARLIDHCRAQHPNTFVGVGSVMNGEAALAFIDRGAAFIVSPTTEPSVVDVCTDRGVPYVPGCGTATEIARASAMGCELIKLFPGDAVGGPGFVRSILGPMPWLRLMPTGGVDITEESLSAWFDAGVSCVGLGSKLVSADLVESRNWATLINRVESVVATIGILRS